MQTMVRLADLADGTITKILLGETPVVLVRSGDLVRAFGGVCPHAGAPLEEGAICNGRLICPWHKATYRIDDGAVVEPPALVGLTQYAVRVQPDRVTVSSETLPGREPTKMRHGRVAAIIGSGAAGAAAASALRYGGYDGRVLLIGEEALQPYDRTSLSKFVVAGEMPSADIPPLRDNNDWDALDVERLDQLVLRVDATARRIDFADGTSIDYGTALFALGGIARRPTLPGIDLTGVRTLRNVADATAILTEARPGSNAVVMGSSFIGLEVASAVCKHGVGVTVVAPEAVPFARQFGDEIGTMFRRLHEANGVTFHLGAEVAALEGHERVRQVVLKDGTRLEAGSVIVGVGVTPATDVVDGVAKADDGGIVVDGCMRAAGSLFVAGDCATFPLRGRRVRIEHWRVAQQHGRVAALGMMGQAARYDGVPFFWTYHYGRNFEYLGHAERWDDLQIDGNLAEQDFIALQIVDERLAGVIACGHEKATASLIEPMREGLSLSEARDIIARA